MPRWKLMARAKKAISQYRWGRKKARINVAYRGPGTDTAVKDGAAVNAPSEHGSRLSAGDVDRPVVSGPQSGSGKIERESAAYSLTQRTALLAASGILSAAYLSREASSDLTGLEIPSPSMEGTIAQVNPSYAQTSASEHVPQVHDKVREDFPQHSQESVVESKESNVVNNINSVPTGVATDYAEYLPAPGPSRPVTREIEASATSAPSWYHVPEDDGHAVRKGVDQPADRRICVPMFIHMPADETGERAKPVFGHLDTGSQLSFVFEKTLGEIGWRDWVDEKEKRQINTLAGTELSCLGTIKLRWSVKGFDKTYFDEFHVLKDHLEEQNVPHFDFLLGREWINPTGAILPNRDVIPDMALYLEIVAQRAPGCNASQLSNLSRTNMARDEEIF